MDSVERSASQKPRSLAILAALVCLLPSLYIFWQARDIPLFGVTEDDGLYFTAAQSLAEGGEYRIVTIPGQPYQTKYPPLYPLLLSLVWRANPIFPGNLALASLLNGLLWLLFLGSAFVFLGECGLSDIGRWTAWALVAISPALLVINSELLSEGLFSSLLLTALWLAERCGTFRKPALAAAFAGILCGAAYLTKTSAMPLLVTTPLVFLFRKQYVRAICFFCGAVPFAAGWTIWTAWHRIPLSDPVELYYRDYLGFYRSDMTWSDLPHLVSLQLVQTLGAIGNSLLHNGPTIVVLVISGLAILGAVRLLTGAKLWHVAGFAGAYIAELLCWDFPVNERFLMPLAPLFLAGLVHESEYAYRMLQKAAAPSRRRLIQRISLAFASAALASILVANGRAIFYSIPDALTRHRTALHHRHAAYSWINRNLPKNSTFAAYHSTDLRLYSGRLAYRNQPLPWASLTGDRPAIERTITGLAEFARQHGLRYILCGNGDYELNDVLSDRALREKLFEKNRGLQRIYASPGVRIYQVGMPEAR